MKTLLAMTLVFATVLTANAQTGTKESEAAIAVQEATTELRRVTSELAVLDESNRRLARSDQAQIDTTKMLDQQQRKIQYEDTPALFKRIDELNEKIQRTRASGCPEEQTMVSVQLANRCNSLNAETSRERAELEAAQNNLNRQIQTINQTRQAVSTTTLENAAQQKKNNAALDDLQAKKQLYSEVIARSQLTPFPSGGAAPASAGLTARDTVPAGTNVDAGAQLKSAEQHSVTAAPAGRKEEAAKGFDTSGRGKGSLVYTETSAGRPAPAFFTNLPKEAKNNPQIQQSVAFYQKLDALKAETARKIVAVKEEQKSGKGDAAVLAAQLGTLTNDLKRHENDQAQAKEAVKKLVKDLHFPWDESAPAPAAAKTKK